MIAKISLTGLNFRQTVVVDQFRDSWLTRDWSRRSECRNGGRAELKCDETAPESEQAVCVGDRVGSTQRLQQT